MEDVKEVSDVRRLFRLVSKSSAPAGRKDDDDIKVSSTFTLKAAVLKLVSLIALISFDTSGSLNELFRTRKIFGKPMVVAVVVLVFLSRMFY